LSYSPLPPNVHSFPTRRSSDLESLVFVVASTLIALATLFAVTWVAGFDHVAARLQAVQPIWFLVALGAEAVAYVGYVLSYREVRSEEHTSELQSLAYLACRVLL